MASTTTSSIRVFGHPSAKPEQVAGVLRVQCGGPIDGDISLAIFAINPNSGIDQETVDIWRSFDDYLTPRLIVVTGLQEGEGDFDDSVMLANRLFDQVATPYLVLHDEQGDPVALIRLEDMKILNYSTGTVVESVCEPEHETLVQEFRNEYLELVESAGEGAFEAGLMFPAIPFIPETGVGVDIVQGFIQQIK